MIARLDHELLMLAGGFCRIQAGRWATSIRSRVERSDRPAILIQKGEPMATEPLKWESVADDTERLPVPGGWLYRVTDRRGIALCFVPDAKARHLRELSRRRAVAALTEMEERPLGRRRGK
jgi:hypothetical protein